MSDIKDLFVSYEIAKQLKEKGFNELCLSNYKYDKLFIGNQGVNFNNVTCKDSEYFSAPLYQQVVDWFREEQNISIWVAGSPYGKHYYFQTINIYNQDVVMLKGDSYHHGRYNTYYEALTKAIEEAIKLIP